MMVYQGRGSRSNNRRCFHGGFHARVFLGSHVDELGFSADFENWQTAAYPTVRTYEFNETGVELTATETRDGERVRYRTGNGFRSYLGDEMIASTDAGLVSLSFLPRATPRLFGADAERLQRLFTIIDDHAKVAPRPFAGSPTRSRPRRTYDPMTLTQGAEGDYVPSYLGELVPTERGRMDAIEKRTRKIWRRVWVV